VPINNRKPVDLVLPEHRVDPRSCIFLKMFQMRTVG